MDFLVRSEKATDVEAISQVTYAAFLGKFSDHPTEHLIVDGLREAGVLTLSLVAEANGRVVGHVAFSPVTVNGEFMDWYGLGPVSVMPELQKRGVGSKLILDGLSQLRGLGAKGCVLEGSPAYYQRFEFKSIPGLTYHAAPAPEYFMALPFYEEAPTGQVEFHKSFYVTS